MGAVMGFFMHVLFVRMGSHGYLLANQKFGINRGVRLA